MRLMIPVAVVLLAGAAVAYWLREDEDVARVEPQAVEQDRPETTPRSPTSMTAERVVDSAGDPAAAAEEPAKAKPWVFPDGTELPPLNGVLEAAPVEWPRDRPYSPVVRRVVDSGGQEWYVHADGSRSTTVRIWRKDLGRYDGITNLFFPLPKDKVLPRANPGAAPAGGGPRNKD